MRETSLEHSEAQPIGVRFERPYGPVALDPWILHPQSIYLKRGKRLLDLSLVLLAAPLLFPLLFCIWLVLRLQGGSAMFVQERVGARNKRFKCFKFRTMVPDAEAVLDRLCAVDPAIAEEWSRHQKLRVDPRVTRFGSILRRSSLDELPQVLNVLRGDMSLVGPRPFLPAQDDIYRSLGGVSYYRLRPGLTGSWQVYSRHDTSFRSRVKFDESYARQVSLRADLGLLFKTIRVVLRVTGS